MRITIDDLLDNSAKIEKASRETLLLRLSEFGREIEVQKISKAEFLEVIEDKSGTAADNITIYKACPIFREPQLLEKLNCKTNPYSVIDKCLTPKTIYALAKRILSFSGLDLNDNENIVQEVENDIKN